MHLKQLQLFGGKFSQSQAVIAGNVSHVAGMVGMEVDLAAPSVTEDPIPPGIEAQMRQAYRTIAWILSQAGTEITDLASQKLFFVGDSGVAQAANQTVRSQVFGARSQASAMVEVAGLFHPACLLEIQATAYRGSG